LFEAVFEVQAVCFDPCRRVPVKDGLGAKTRAGGKTRLLWNETRFGQGQKFGGSGREKKRLTEERLQGVHEDVMATLYEPAISPNKIPATWRDDLNSVSMPA